jgi:hypothetical protein
VTHQRKEIREYLKNLFAGEIAPVKNVFTSRDQSVNSDLLPSLTISTPEEIPTPRNINQSSQYIRKLTVKIEARCEANADSGADDLLDLMLSDIEDSIFADPTLNGLIAGMTLTLSTSDIDTEVEKPVALGVLTFEVTYFT